MLTVRIIAIAMLGLIVAAAVLAFRAQLDADLPAADTVLKQVVAKYEDLATYKSSGTITMNMDMGISKLKQVTSFTVLLQKPNLYLITWDQQGGPLTQSGKVWSDGTQPMLYMSSLNSYSKMVSDEMALAAATGISSGAAFTIPSFFLSVFEQPNPISRLIAPKVEKIEKIGEDDCYVISGASELWKQETYWISKESLMIRKYFHSLEAPAASTPELTDKELEAAIKGSGQEVTAESIKNMKAMMASTRKMMGSMRGSSTELHASISFPELTAADFQTSPPQGATLNETLFGPAETK